MEANYTSLSALQEHVQLKGFKPWQQSMLAFSDGSGLN